MRYCLVRILGNDQPPRHSINQTERNTRFILEHEPKFKNCDKCFILNRIWDPATYNKIHKLVRSRGYKILTIPFVAKEYLQLTSTADKFLYLTNQNEARNFAIKELLDTCDVLLPFDGGTCFRASGWQQLINGINSRALLPYYLVPMWRLKSFNEYTSGQPILTETTGTEIRPTEPQICFTRDSDRRFTEGMAYGKGNKLDMLWMLGVPGPWQHWLDHLREEAYTRMSKYAGTIKSYGFVCRLPSGNVGGDRDMEIRSQLRKSAISQSVEAVDNRLI